MGVGGAEFTTSFQIIINKKEVKKLKFESEHTAARLVGTALPPASFLSLRDNEKSNFALKRRETWRELSVDAGARYHGGLQLRLLSNVKLFRRPQQTDRPRGVWSTKKKNKSRVSSVRTKSFFSKKKPLQRFTMAFVRRLIYDSLRE